ncbi:MAG TPA: winged helix-turn-helix transcriptional regulator [Dehalococcoidia bacterium]|jgi:DNA-binding HxlR family transcriptional regulator|nr:winged helix-turn-helix transcriptional regulator [Dehalococcoidia bacterium]
MLRARPGLSAKLIHERLRKMTRVGIVQRTVFGEKLPVEVNYPLSPFGRPFMGVSRRSASAPGGRGHGTMSERAAIRQGMSTAVA